MSHRFLLVFGPIAAATFFVSMFVLGAMVKDYSHVSQTVSEIGMRGSPVELPFKIAMLAVTMSILIFAFGIYLLSKANHLSSLPAWFVAAYGLSDLGIDLFPLPHRLHNVFGILSIVCVYAPLVLAVAWQGSNRAAGLISISWIAFVLINLAILLNLDPDLLPEKYYGLVQRSFFVAFYGWCAFVGIVLFLQSRPRHNNSLPRSAR